LKNWEYFKAFEVSSLLATCVACWVRAGQWWWSIAEFGIQVRVPKAGVSMCHSCQGSCVWGGSFPDLTCLRLDSIGLGWVTGTVRPGWNGSYSITSSLFPPSLKWPILCRVGR